MSCHSCDFLKNLACSANFIWNLARRAMFVVKNLAPRAKFVVRNLACRLKV